MIRMSNIYKSFKDKTVLDGINLEVNEGEIFALLGPSGAGKTTIINILTKWIEADSGEAEISVGQNEIGIMLDSGGLYTHLNCLENLDLYARIYDLPKTRPMEILESVGLGGDDAKKAASELSRGMFQRLALARAILYSPKVLILDEPTSALDPGTARSVCKLLQKIRENGTTIFLTTHNMDEALKLCDRVALLFEGKIVKQGNPVEICEEHNALRTVPDLEAVFLEMTGVEL